MDEPWKHCVRLKEDNRLPNFILKMSKTDNSTKNRLMGWDQKATSFGMMKCCGTVIYAEQVCEHLQHLQMARSITHYMNYTLMRGCSILPVEPDSGHSLRPGPTILAPAYRGPSSRTPWRAPLHCRLLLLQLQHLLPHLSQNHILS